MCMDAIVMCIYSHFDHLVIWSMAKLNLKEYLYKSIGYMTAFWNGCNIVMSHSCATKFLITVLSFLIFLDPLLRRGLEYLSKS